MRSYVIDTIYFCFSPSPPSFPSHSTIVSRSFMNHTLSVTAANKLTVEKFVLYTNIIYNIHFYLYIYIYIYIYIFIYIIYTLVFFFYSVWVCNSPPPPPSPCPRPRYITVRSISLGAWYNAYNSLCIELSMRKWYVWTIRYSAYFTPLSFAHAKTRTNTRAYRHIPFVHCFLPFSHSLSHSLSLSLSLSLSRKNTSRHKHTSTRTHTHISWKNNK